MQLGLAGKTCIVTGASRGIGRETARLLADDGAEVLLAARNPDGLAAALIDCPGGATLAIDITEPDAGERLVAAALEQFGRLDVVVNNAGAARRRDLDEVSDDDFYAAFELNVMAPHRLMRAAIPVMVSNRWGRVVNVSSTAGKRPSAAMPEYSVTKAAELSLSRLYADRYAAAGVLVNAVCPGPVASEMWMAPGGLLDQSVAADGHPDRRSALDAAGSSRPIGRLAEVGEIAATIVFLCSERASYVAGSAWGIDGGTVQVII